MTTEQSDRRVFITEESFWTLIRPVKQGTASCKCCTLVTATRAKRFLSNARFELHHPFVSIRPAREGRVTRDRRRGLRGTLSPELTKPTSHRSSFQPIGDGPQTCPASPGDALGRKPREQREPKEAGLRERPVAMRLLSAADDRFIRLRRIVCDPRCHLWTRFAQ